MRRLLAPLLLALTTLVSLAPSDGEAATLHVRADDPTGAIGRAVRAAAAGDRIVLGEGTFHEAVVLDRGVTVEGAPGFGTTVEVATAWSLEARGARLQGITFVGRGAASVGVLATAPFVVQDCHFSGYGTAVAAHGVYGASAVMNSRLDDNAVGIALIGSGHSSYVLVQGNQIHGDGLVGIYAQDTRWRGLDNTLSGARVAVWHRLPAHRKLSISYVRGNTIGGAWIGLLAQDVDRWELRALDNVIDAWTPQIGVPAADFVRPGEVPAAFASR